MLRATVNFDGESFFMCIPAVWEMNELYEFFDNNTNQEIRDMKNNFITPCIVYDFSMGGILTLFVQSLTEILPLGHITPDGDLVVTSDRAKNVGFRPILIPLGKDGKPSRFKETEFPNGSTTQGGTLYVDGKPTYSCMTDPDNPDDKIRVALGDTDTFICTYVVYKGLMYMDNPLMWAHMNYIFNNWDWTLS